MNSPIEISISTSDIFEGLSVSQTEVDTYIDLTMKNLAQSYLSEVEKQAQSKLNSTRQRYIQNLKFVDSGRLEGTALLDYSKDPLIRMLEEGVSAFDMKQNFLKSSKVKFTKSGKPYLTIPFRFSTPSAVGESDVFQSKMPQEVYEVAKSKIANIQSSGGLRSQPVKLSELSPELQKPSTRSSIPGFGEYTHKTSIYQGITKRKDPVTGQNTYGSFRRVSLNSDPRSWIHSGLEPRNLMDSAFNNFQLENEITRSLDVVFESMGFNSN